MTKWIDINKKLPKRKDHGLLLVAGDHDNFGFAVWEYVEYIDECSPVSGDGMAFGLVEWLFQDYDHGAITHWARIKRPNE